MAIYPASSPSVLSVTDLFNVDEAVKKDEGSRVVENPYGPRKSCKRDLDLFFNRTFAESSALENAPKRIARRFISGAKLKAGLLSRFSFAELHDSFLPNRK